MSRIRRLLSLKTTPISFDIVITSLLSFVVVLKT
ncbi:hypothetical protein Avbf_00693 [Armadillidium vulgare]|nr:hypothetical protein Avbf_00693 [Armadillidium vulgare]